MSTKIFVLSSVCAATLVVAACGGGDAVPVATLAPAATTPASTTTAVVTTPVTTTPVTTTPVTTTPVVTAPTTPVVAGTVTSLTGSVVKGPVGNATVTATKADGTACGTTATNATGQYAFTTSCTGDVILTVTGGSYLDEATNTTKVLATPLKSVIAATGGTVNGVVTPLTSMAFSYAFTSNNAATKAAFDAQAAKIATQFQLTGVNLGTDLPVVTGVSNAYGKALIAVSQYLKDNPSKTLEAVTTASFKTALQASEFGASYTAAFNRVNGSNVTFTFDGTAFNITGTGAGGGSATCGISQRGSFTVAGLVVPISFDYCVSGLVGACDAGNQSLNQSLSAQNTSVGANITTTYQPACAAGAISIVVK